MNCRDCRPYLISDTLETLSLPEQRRLKAHLAGCATCRSLRAQVQADRERILSAMHATPVQGLERTRQLVAAPITRKLMQRRSVRRRLGQSVGVAVQFGLLGCVVLVLIALIAPASAPARMLATLAARAFAAPPDDADLLWIVAVDPPAGARLLEPTPVRVRVGYALSGAPTAVLSLRLIDSATGSARYFAQPVAVRAGRGEALLELLADPAWLRSVHGSGPLHLEVTLRAADSAALPTQLLAYQVVADHQLVVP
jgi:predicted anti-sigma-YlaC factor YlaD